MKKSSSKQPMLEKIIKLAEARNAEAETLEKNLASMVFAWISSIKNSRRIEKNQNLKRRN